MQSDDNEQRTVLFILLPILVLVVGGVLGLGVLKAKSSHLEGMAEGVGSQVAAPAVPAVLGAQESLVAAAESDATEPSTDDASVVVDAGVVKFYFASGSADLAIGAGAALGDAVAAAKAGRFVLLSGFHDETGDAAFNSALAKRRAMAVRAQLLMAGAPEDRLVMKKPEVLTGSGSNAQARRVEVVISDNSVQ